MPSKLLILLCLLLTLSARAQTRLTGTVVDEQRRPVPYASVALPDGSAGTATNEVGEFSLSVPALPQRLVVLSIGYARTEVAATTVAPLTITLPASAVQLPEVVVRDPRRVAEELVRRAYAQLVRHQKDTYYGKAFYRQKTRNNGVYDELLDAFYDVEFNPQIITGWDLGESRYAVAASSAMHMRNFSLLMRHLPVFIEHPKRGNVPYLPLAPESARQFVFTLREVQTADGRETAVIDFRPRPGLDRPATTGTLYLDRQTATLRRQDLCVAVGGTMIKDFPNGFRLLSDTLRLVRDFAPVADSLSRLTSTRGELTLAVRQGEKPPVTTKITAYLLLYQYTGRLPGQVYGKVKQSADDLNALKNQPYNAQFWQDNAIIRASPVEQEVIRSFEGRQAFGQL